MSVIRRSAASDSTANEVTPVTPHRTFLSHHLILPHYLLVDILCQEHALQLPITRLPLITPLISHHLSSLISYLSPHASHYLIPHTTHLSISLLFCRRRGRWRLWHKHYAPFLRFAILTNPRCSYHSRRRKPGALRTVVPHHAVASFRRRCWRGQQQRRQWQW